MRRRLLLNVETAANCSFRVQSCRLQLRRKIDLKSLCGAHPQDPVTVQQMRWSPEGAYLLLQVRADYLRLEESVLSFHFRAAEGFSPKAAEKSRLKWLKSVKPHMYATSVTEQKYGLRSTSRAFDNRPASRLSRRVEQRLRY